MTAITTKKIFEQWPDTAAQTAALQHHVSVDTYLDYSKLGDIRYSSWSQHPLKDNWN